MSLLFKHLRVHQIFGANTDVGKTILTTALVRASTALRNEVFYLKPISTGSPQDADDEHIKQFASPKVHTECLYRFHVPVSPHLAAQMAAGDESQKIVSDKTFVDSVISYVNRSASATRGPAHMYVETAGGVHSPALSGTTQVDCYRPLFLPTILIGDSRLGGISATISAYESLLLRGYMVDSVLLFRDEYYRNSEYLTPYFAERGIDVAAFAHPPPVSPDPRENLAITDEYYKSLDMGSVQRVLTERHQQRIDQLDSMPRRSMDAFWWPFVQHGLVKNEKDVTVIDSASNDFFSIYSQSSQDSLLSPQLDSSASWWTQTLGHSHPSLTLAAARAAGRYGHVMFPQATHEPALKLAERLLHHGPGRNWASRVFFSDDGSTGMEVALKMALRAYSVRMGLQGIDRKNLGVLGLKGSYHGDTIGAMDACAEEGVYTCEWHNAKGFWFDPPTISIQTGVPVISLPSVLAKAAAPSDTCAPSDSIAWVYDMPARLETRLAQSYRTYISQTLDSLEQSGGPRLAALVLEPLVMGAGGMLFVDPLFQRVLIDVVRSRDSAPESKTDWRGLPVIFDEVFVGLYRLGAESTIPILGVNPDISVHAKILTGGLVPLAVTMASDSIFQAFVSQDKATALLHGHSYTAHAVGCEVANETLKLIEKESQSAAWNEAKDKWGNSAAWSLWDPEFIRALSSLDKVSEVMTLGTVLAVKMKDAKGGYVSHSAQTLLQDLKNSKVGAKNTYPPFSVHYRTLGNVAYFMTSLNTSPETIRALEEKIWTALQSDSADEERRNRHI
ncbi:PLP-dependent transferase [Mycena indigotica]|uniref:PLP-dependent transferase n=1 Tax=Mycena indigotica TaxID=2126181 RepID=A0A8H6S1N0_9AGAR|nr:PLP-dependent transferase [Mycena indigotica]KAF7290678.1 PLP-dependent transferase [Mycena indigotica]